MNELPDPLVPAEVDLRDFAYMPLDVQRLRDSDLASDETPEACWAAVLLWCAAWHQVPAGSIPDNDGWHAKQCGYVAQGRVSTGWKRIRDGALRGWVLCSDGRRYHPVVAEKAREAWRQKLMQRWRSECARIKKHCQRHEMKLLVPDFESWIAMGCPQGQPLPVPEDRPDVSSGQADGVPRETPSKGTERNGTELKEDPPTPRKRGASVHEFPPGFDAFWSAYPRKTGKLDAARVFARLRPDPPMLARMLDAVRQQAASEQWTRDGGQFIPHPSTWLHQGRWEDEPPQLAKADRFGGAR